MSKKLSTSLQISRDEIKYLAKKKNQLLISAQKWHGCVESDKTDMSFDKSGNKRK